MEHFDTSQSSASAVTTPTDTSRLKVLYIAGLGRSGSTIIDSILGQTDGIFSVGELHRLWDSGPVYDRVCGCGMPLVDCEIWSQVLEQALGGPEGLADADLTSLKDRGYRTRHLPRLMRTDGRAWIREALGPTMDALSALDQAVADVTNSRVIVDSSKFPSYGFVLDSIDAIDVYVLHLVRDPRAVAYSWQRDKFDPGTGQSLGTMSPSKTAALWLSWNYAIERLWQGSERYYQLRYEDFATQPQATIQALLDYVGEGEQRAAFLDPQTVRLQPSHSVCGNPVRFDQGETTIQLDTRWERQLSRAARQVTTSIDWPLMPRYGYEA